MATARRPTHYDPLTTGTLSFATTFALQSNRNSLLRRTNQPELYLAIILSFHATVQIAN
jgi:hypothetical protein